MLLLALVQALVLPSQGQDKVVKTIIQLGQTDNRTMQYLDVLSNRIGGRILGSNAYDNAVAWSVFKV